MNSAEIGVRLHGTIKKIVDSQRHRVKAAKPSALMALWWIARTSFYQELKAVFNSYPEIFFIQNAWVGLAFFLITMANPSVGLAGITAVVFAYAFARFLKMERVFLESGFYTYNPLLVGLSLGHNLQITALSMLLIAMTGILTFIVAIGMSSLFTRYLRLPVLSLPFVLVSWCASLASHRYSNLLVSENFGPGPGLPFSIISPEMAESLPAWVAGYFRSFGAILFDTSVQTGMLVCLLVLIQSRILFLLSLLGFFVGVSGRALMLGSFNMAACDLNNFNFILIAMAVGGVYLVPSIRSYVMAAVAVLVSIVVFDSVFAICAPFRLPGFTLPFNLVTLAFLFMLELLQSPLYARFIGKTPEETLESEYANRMRYTGQLRTLFLPFSGKWTVWQGFDGGWTHKGNWRYAYDFVITDDQGKTYSGEGSKLENFYCFQKPVLSPIRGRVVAMVDDLPDNPPGDADKLNNWGNALVIQDYAGYFVEISHFAEKSMRVKVGDTVERGTVLGLCGNSGYSPQPHIHVQVQATETIGAPSLPFSFVSYASEGNYFANDCPAEKQKVEPLYPDRKMDAQTSFVLDEVYSYGIYRKGRETSRLTLTVKMAPDGTFYFDSGRGRLYFGKHEGTFYLYRVDGSDKWLRAMLLALPRMPLSYRSKLAWNDCVPASIASSGARKTVVQLLSAFYPNFAAARVTQRFAERGVTECRVARSWFFDERRTEVAFGESKGFSSFKLGEIELRRIENENNLPDRA